MNVAERNKKIKGYHQEQMDILNKKGMDYTGGSLSVDASFDAKEIARRLQGAPMDALTVRYMLMCKNILALETYVKTRVLESENIRGRCFDIANYINIILADIEKDERDYKDLVGSVPKSDRS